MKNISASHPSALSYALDEITEGHIIAIPTDTVYGLACDPRQNTALEKLYTIKGRNSAKLIPHLVATVEIAEQEVVIDSTLKKGLERLWPGALTGVFPLRSGYGTQAIRIPDHTFILLLLERLGRPLAVTSLNESGEDPIVHAIDARDFCERNEGIALLVDDGDVPDSIASTVVDFSRKPYHILRQGPVSKKLLEEVLHSTIE